MLLLKLGSDLVYDNVNSTVGLYGGIIISRERKILFVVADDSFHCNQQHLNLRSSIFKEDNDNSYLVGQCLQETIKRFMETSDMWQILQYGTKKQVPQ